MINYKLIINYKIFINYNKIILFLNGFKKN